MINRKEEDIGAVIKKFEAKLEGQLGRTETSNYSNEYLKFKQEVIPNLTIYEKLCRNLGNIVKVKIKKEDEEKIASNLEGAHLDIEAKDAAAFSLVSFLLMLLLSGLISVGIFLITGNFPMGTLVLLFFVSVFVYYYTNDLPKRLAQKWRLKSSSQMVPCILYIVVFMRHTSNLELAVKFAAEHLQNPLALDFKKVLWNVETGRYSTIKESLDAYLESWRTFSMEFVEAFHLIESSLYEPSEARRVQILEKALSTILDGVYEKMLHYSHDIQSPLTNLYMLGIVLPTLAIALLPLASTLIGGVIKWYHVSILFNMLIPFLVFYMTSQVLSKRPGGYGEAELLEQNPNYPAYKSRKPYYKAALIAVPILLLGLLPLAWQYTPIPEVFGLQKDYTFAQLGIPFMQDSYIFDFKTEGGVTTGPFGLIALLLSLCIPISIASFFIISYNLKTKNLIETRENTKKLEKEFASSLFQLGNRLGDRIPAEMAFGRVAESLRGTPTADFFLRVNGNIQRLGMSVQEAIFNKKVGAIIYFPSNLVRTSMKILIESVKKGLDVAARALMSISEYLKNIHKVDERLRDLLADIVSSMKSNMSFLAPMLAGIVIGLASMITTILGRLQGLMTAGAGETSLMGGVSVETITTLFNITSMIPPYYLQIATGCYIIEIVFILSITLVSVESGLDRLGEKVAIAKNLKSSIIMYSIVSLLAILSLTMLAALAIGGMTLP